MKCFAWDAAKNANLRTARGIAFEDVVFHIDRGDLLDILEHLNPDPYAGQCIFVVQRDNTCTWRRGSCVSSSLDRLSKTVLY